MNGLDLLAILIVIVLATCWLWQQAIDRHDRERREARKAVHNILRATGQLR